MTGVYDTVSKPLVFKSYEVFLASGFLVRLIGVMTFFPMKQLGFENVKWFMTYT